MSINIPSSASFNTKGLPQPKAVINRLPVVVRDRMPNVPMPVEYEEACKALAACVSVDEGKYWSDKADALAAWAKIYKSDEAAIAARRLKLQAFRRMGELAQELQPPHRPAASGQGKAPGPVALLKAHGLNTGQCQSARRLAALERSRFKGHVEAGSTIARAAWDGRGMNGKHSASSDAWAWLSSANYNKGARLHVVRSEMRSRNPHDVAAGITKGETKRARELVIELIEWLDAFEQALPKEPTRE